MTKRNLDFTPVRNKEMTYQELAANLTVDDLRELTHGMVDTILELIADCTDEDVIFTPEDPEANDTFAAREEDRDLAWTLGHVIVHTTASSEESAALAAELARGVEYHGRSRSEVPWDTVATLKQCRDRLEESRRMRLASLDMWPDNPYLENTYRSRPESDPINAVTRFVLGLSHADSHLGQIREIIRQAKAAHGAQPA
ncbi:MAG TPA: DinB family protein [Anaerolineae bacterium]|nr:DinB family protein [Anaerolineae bacterium]